MSEQVEQAAEYVGTAHPRCERPNGHTCQQLSGQTCIEYGCDDAAGTLWGPLWCPEHDADRLNNVSAGFAAMERAFRPGQPPAPEARA